MKLLERLNIGALNPGSCLGPDGWGPLDRDTVLDSINPATEDRLGRVVAADADDYEVVLKGSASAFERWRQVPAPERGELVRRIADRLRACKPDLGRLVSLEMGKVLAEGEGEVQEMIDVADYAVGLSRMLGGRTLHSERPLHRMYEQWHPLGVTGVVTAFNFPVAVWAWNAFIAAVCGNTVVWKPSPRTPLCALAVQHLCNQAMREAGVTGVFSMFVDATSALAQRLVDDRRVALLSFTGSTRVGRRVAERVASRLGRSLLELSGNNAVTVDETADLDLAVKAILFGAVGTAGQRCTTTRRVFFQEVIYDDVLERLLRAYGRIRVGDPLEEGVIMGPLVHAGAVDDFVRVLDDAREEGGSVLYGGSPIPGAGHFVQPTLVAMKAQTPIVRAETFAPILYVMCYGGLEEAIALQNGVPQGLSSSLFTNSLRNSERFLSVIGSDCGIANVNIGTSGAEIGGAFGGEKDTGGGREAGSDAWKAYMRRQTTTINWGADLPLAQGIRFDLTD
ncbi:MAG: aldehyde dehydrogenase family protein [Pseudomonadota bacterium]|nr:aldehyde dehydrogenase family protein [Pseudomonadota bacterium]